jgi:MFS transporter, DHA2 family, multidrug resistance protein
VTEPLASRQCAPEDEHDTAMNAASTEGGGRATRREWLGLAVLALPVLLLSIDVSVLYLALPVLSRDLRASATQQLWILDIYSFFLAGFLVTMGTLGDRIGRRRLLLIGAAAFGVASIFAAYSTSAEMLILARALLGIAGATLMPSTLALIRNMFKDPGQMSQALGIWLACFTVGLALGPLVGGILLENFWWGSVFLLGVPFMALLLATGPLVLPEYRDAKAGRLDLRSVGLSLAAILPLIYGLKELARGGWQTLSVVAIVVGLVVGAVFVWRQRTVPNPLLDLHLFGNHRFSSALGSYLLLGIVMAGVSLMATLYLQMVHGLSPLTAGLWLIPQNVAMGLSSVLAPVLAQRVRPVVVMAVGMVIAAAGLGLVTQIPAGGDLDGVVLLVSGLVLASGGIALAMPLITGVILQAAPPERAGSAASLQETSGEFGIALGVASMGSLATLVYRLQLAGNLPAGLPAQIADSAREGIVGAVVAASQLPAQLAQPLLEVARTAYTGGVHVVAVLGAIVFLGVASLARTIFREPDSSAPDSVSPGVPSPARQDHRPSTSDV